MRDWKAAARARGIEIPAEQLERTVKPLNEVEVIFRSLIAGLSPDIEPAFGVRLEDEE